MGRAGIRAAYATGRGRVTIRARHEFEDFGKDRTRIVIKRDVGGHAHGDAAGAVHQQVGEPGGEGFGLLPGLVEVGVPAA